MAEGRTDPQRRISTRGPNFWDARPLPHPLSDEALERAGTALVNADAQEPYDRTDGRWRPAVLAEAVIRSVLGIEDGGSS